MSARRKRGQASCIASHTLHKNKPDILFMKYTVIGPSFCLISKEMTKNKDVSEGNCPFSPQVF